MATDSPPPPSRSVLRKRFLALAVPSIAASLLVPVQGLVDTALLGHLDAVEPLAAVALAGVIFDLLYWSFGFLRMGTTGLTAQAIGREQTGEAQALLLRALTLAAIGAATMLVLQGPIARLAFAVLDGAPAVERAGRAYYDARIWAAPAVLANYCAMGWLLALSRGRAMLALALVGNGANIALDYLFILELGWGAAGAGWATTISQYASLAVAVPLVSRSWSRLRAADPSQVRGPVFGLGVMRPLLRLGRDIWLRSFALISAFALFTSFSAVFSSTILAANAILLKVLGLVSYVVDGFALATETLTGEHRGRDDTRGLETVLGMATIWGLATAAGFALTFLLAPELFHLISDQPELVAAVVDARLALVAVLLLGALAYILDGYFIGLAAGRTMARAMLVSFGLGFMPLALWARYGEGGPEALWWAMLAFMAARVVTLGVAVPATLRADEPTQRPAPR